ncbi:winged helix-turn-helix domain-containing protein [Micromonospora robiginosa]|uniref:Winged helix-turn-helix domain-containing protein n=1 Tax=Micromonospora robiginosa TaxID=2749844 RepID=A0AAF0T0F8_9ACTN|nr:winged helix-turn-helix domain-containing protein [Micromonospora ferruginea]WMF04557.1 winged helix-turn-helix domain-containing protein [Micromonospora ferruginea]
MTTIPSLVIGIASSATERRQLAQLLGGTETFLIVSSAHQARRFLDLVRRPTSSRDAGAVPSGVDAEGAAGDVVAAASDVETVDRRPALAVDSDRRVLRWREREVGLTPLEHDLLVCLAGTPGQVWTYARLHREVWGNDHLGRGSDMHSVVRRIRHKLGRLDAAATIHAVRGVGFRLTPS